MWLTGHRVRGQTCVTTATFDLFGVTASGTLSSGNILIVKQLLQIHRQFLRWYVAC